MQVQYEYYTMKENLLDLDGESGYELTKISTLEIKDIAF
jgi:hypothetical protein